MNPSWRQIGEMVRTRARERCEYCKMHQSLQGATFHVEHVIPESRGGVSSAENLAWCCPSCNLHKADRVEVIDPGNGLKTLLFNPRADSWAENFRWEGYHLVGITGAGRATVTALKLNDARRLLIRQAEQRFALFPPGGE
jgi:hypothetical protein